MTPGRGPGRPGRAGGGPAPTGAPARDAVVEFASPGGRTWPTVSVRADPLATVLTSIVEFFGPLSHRLPPVALRQARTAARHLPMPLLVQLTATGLAQRRRHRSCARAGRRPAAASTS